MNTSVHALTESEYIQTAVDYQKNRIHYDGLLDRLLANFE